MKSPAHAAVPAGSVGTGEAPGTAVQPGKVLGIFDRCGSLEAGKNANAVVLDADLNVKAVFFRGCQVQ